jgi:predicted nucleic acid-binding protein
MDGRAHARLGRHRPTLARKPLTLVLDSNVVLMACSAPDGFAPFSGEELVAPPLMWSEFLSSVREASWRGDVSRELAVATTARLEDAPIRARTGRRHRAETLRIAVDFGWAKTYDAEYVALGSLLDCTVITQDLRLRRGTERLGFVRTLAEWRRR